MEEIEHGICGSQRNTSWVFRDSSSLTSAQRLEQKVYYHTAKDILQMSIELLHHIAHLAFSNYSLSVIINSMACVQDAINSAMQYFRDKRKAIHNAIMRLLFLAWWIQLYEELALLYAEDLTIFVRTRN